MSAAVLTACGLTGAGQSIAVPGTGLSPVTFIRQRNGVDGSFLLATLLGHHLKLAKANRAILVATHHNYAHYNAACQKLMVNLTPAVSSGQLTVVDVPAELHATFPSPVAATLPSLADSLTAIAGDPDGLLVVIDDLSYFLHFDSTVNDLLDFVENIADRRWRLLLKLNTADCYERLCSNLEDMADTVLTVEPLASGNFRDVDGRLTVHRTVEASPLTAIKELQKTVLYKVHDRQIRCFVPGELGIKNL